VLLNALIFLGFKIITNRFNTPPLANTARMQQGLNKQSHSLYLRALFVSGHIFEKKMGIKNSYTKNARKDNV
jgi:hypothetical protein